MSRLATLLGIAWATLAAAAPLAALLGARLGWTAALPSALRRSLDALGALQGERSALLARLSEAAGELAQLEDALADIQQAGEELLAAAGYRQYEVSAYSRPGKQCRHNLNYWTFGDYLGIGAGAHGKVTRADGSILRYAKRRQPAEYLASPRGYFTASRQEVPRRDIIGEFMLNALRLNEGFSMDLFTARTGLDASAIAPQADNARPTL